MGDAGPPTPPVQEQILQPHQQQQQQQQVTRDVHVLVTGFGAFKSFNTNPSWLIAASLPQELDPQVPPDPKSWAQQDAVQHNQHTPPPPLFGRPAQHTLRQPLPAAPLSPLRPPNSDPYRIHIHTYPHPVRVAYSDTAKLVPTIISSSTNGPLLAPSHEPVQIDYILHIGLASGRDSYTLEIQANRSDYVIPDIDEVDAYPYGPAKWIASGIPDTLHVGWGPADVLRRWQADVGSRWDSFELQEMEKQMSDTRRAQEAQTQALQALSQTPSTGLSSGVRHWIVSHLQASSNAPPPASPHDQTQAGTLPSGPFRRPRQPVVKLSKDAGRYLCEFILMCSLVYRHREAQEKRKEQETLTQMVHTSLQPSRAVEAEWDAQLGKVAFLHVPNGIDRVDIEKGRLVAECAIRSLVASWEGGYRNEAVFGTGRNTPAETGDGSGFEHAETGDR